MSETDAEEQPQDQLQAIRIEDTEQSQAIRIAETEQFRRFGVEGPIREVTARTLALILIWTFAGVLLCSLLIGTYVLWKSGNIDDKTLTAATEFLKVTSAIFAPLLAFVLGYYFSKREE